MSNLKLVAFDIDGVLFDWRGGLNQVSKETRIDATYIREYILKNLENLENGKLDSIKFWEDFITNFNLDKDPQQIFNTWVLNQEKISQNWKLAKDYKLKGLKLAICSNSWGGLIKIFIDNYQEFEIFDYKFDSSKIGFVKPQKEFFEYVEKQTGFIGTEILLIDDSIENISGARNFGWQTKLII